MAEQQQALVGGVEAQPSEFPQVVSLGGCSGTLIHPRLVLYAAHCGEAVSEVRFGVDADHPERVVRTERCEAHPNARLGDGSDLAFCLLGEAVDDIAPARLLAGCERTRLAPGGEAVLVGFGLEKADGSYGVQRWGSARLRELGADIIMDAGETDTCLGDSGGPVFVPVETAPGLTEHRLLGVTSAGDSHTCGEGESHYANASLELEWLEQASELDLTPCFDGDSWAPSPGCTATTAPPTRLSTCGASASTSPDLMAPRVSIVEPAESKVARSLAPGESYIETPVRATASDAEGQLREVSFTLLDADGAQLMQRIDERAPFELSTLRLPAGRYRLEVRARDWAGHLASDETQFDIRGHEAAPLERAGCSISVRNQHPPLAGAALLLLGFVARSRRKRPRAQRLYHRET